MKGLGLGLLLLLATRETLAQECDLRSQRPVQEVRTLSNGTRLPIPTLSCDFNMAMVMGSVDMARASRLLAPLGLHPLTLDGQKGIGLFSVYDYRSSDIGNFQESYFVLVGTTDPKGTIMGSWEALLRTLRGHPQGPDRKIGLFHVHVLSSTQNARLMSKEVWGIDSTLAEVSMQETHRGPILEIAEDSEKALKVDLRGPLWAPNPLGVNFHVYATGPAHGHEAPKWSPVEAWGPAKSARFRHTHRSWRFFGGSMAASLSSLSFDPQMAHWGSGLKAAQHAPEGAFFPF